MATSLDYIEFVCSQIDGVGMVTYKKMFGEYMVYVNSKPVFLVCDNTVYVKMLECIKDQMNDSETGEPYRGSKMHYILDIDNIEFSKEIVKALELVIPIPTPRKKKSKSV